MARPSKDTRRVATRLEVDDFEKLEALLTAMGYTYKRDGALQPAWSEWLAAIAKGDIITYKKVDLPIDDN